ncbi:hypothetical protein Syncc8109_1747 [Synechococcus sp. WH 8109]|nr:hypothetical protein Syncc8109_1747 [Synechococcus sp. WH 8109]
MFTFLKINGKSATIFFVAIFGCSKQLLVIKLFSWAVNAAQMCHQEDILSILMTKRT